MTVALSGLAALAMTGFWVAFIALMLFMALIQPLWCLVDCVVDAKRSTLGKVLWIVALIALYGLANWFYGAFAAAGPALRRLTRLAWAFAIVLALAFALMYALHAEFRRGIEQQWQQRRGMVVQVDRAIEFALAQEAGHAR
jgi:hypothetical protein